RTLVRPCAGSAGRADPPRVSGAGRAGARAGPARCPTAPGTACSARPVEAPAADGARHGSCPYYAYLRGPVLGPGCAPPGRTGMGQQQPVRWGAGRSGGGDGAMATLAERMVGAARLDAGTYEEVEADTGATGQAALVVIISSVCLAIGAHLGAGLLGLVLMAVFRLIGWYVWALVTYLIGARLMPQAQTRADVGQLLRTLGFASTPGVLAIFAVIPGIGSAVNLVVGIWMLVAM